MTYTDLFDLLPNVAQVARKCPTPTLRRAYVTAMRKWCKETQWLRTTISGATAADTSLYSLGSDTYLEIVGIAALSGADNSVTPAKQWPIGPSDPGGWNPNADSAQPRVYTYVPEGQFSLYPTPDAVYGITATAIVQPKEGVTQVPVPPLAKYGTVFEAGALAYLLAMSGMPWSNPNEAAKKEREFRSGISNGKAEVQRGFNTGAQRARPRRFLT